MQERITTPWIGKFVLVLFLCFTGVVAMVAVTDEGTESCGGG